MKTRDEILHLIEALLPGLGARYAIGGIELFGSYSRNEHTEDSDIDLAIEFTGPMSYRQHMALEDELTAALGKRVDIVDRRLLKPRIRQRVEREAIAV